MTNIQKNLHISEKSSTFAPPFEGRKPFNHQQNHQHFGGIDGNRME